MWVNFKAVKAGVPMEAALARYGIRLRRISRDYLRGACPLPTHQSQASNQSFIVNTAKNVWSCQSASCIAARGGCVGGNVLDFVAIMAGCSIRDAALSLQQTVFGRPSPCLANRRRVEHEIGSSRLPQSSREAKYKPLPFVLSGIDCLHPYLSERGISPEIARLFGVGYYPGRGIVSQRIVIPVHSPEGALVAYVGRSIDSREPRYRFPAGFCKSLFLFNLHRAVRTPSDRRTVVVVEGFFDCMKVYQAGCKSVVALMGSTLSEAQVELLRGHFREVVLMLDGDESGRAALPRIATRLERSFRVGIVEVPLGMQPDEMAPDRIRQLLSSLDLTPITVESQH